MSHALTVGLLLLTGLLMAFVIMFTSSGLFAYYILETVRRILRSGRRGGNLKGPFRWPDDPFFRQNHLRFYRKRQFRYWKASLEKLRK